MARDEKLIIRVNENTKNEFVSLAEEMGLTMSALGSYVIGNYIKEQKQKKLMNERMIESLTPELIKAAELRSMDPKLIKNFLDSIQINLEG